MKRMNKKGQDVLLGIGAIVFIVVLVGGLFVYLLGVDKVEPSHMGVMVKFGQITGIFKSGDRYSGMAWTGMFTDVFQYDMRTRKAVIELGGENYAPSVNGQKIFASINVNYRVKKSETTIMDLYSNIGPDNIISDRLNIDAIITEAFKQSTVGYTAMDILEKRQEVKEKAIANIRKNFPEEYFEIENIVVTNIAFSKEFADEIEKKQIAIQAALKEENQLEVVKYQQQQEIERYKAEAMKIQLQAAQLTQLTINQRMLEKWDGHLPATLIMSDQSNGLLLNLAKGDIMTDPTLRNSGGGGGGG